MAVACFGFAARVFPFSQFSRYSGAGGSRRAMCGKLVAVADAPAQGKANSSQQEPKPLPHERIRLFSPTASGDCCALMTPLAEVFTGRDGTFQFKKLTPGDYMVVATIGNKDYKLLVRLVPGKKGSTQCSAFLYTFEKGQIQLQGLKP